MRVISARVSCADARVSMTGMCGAVLNARLFSFINQELEELKFEKIFYIVDSEIAKVMISTDSYGFSTFVANR